MLGATGKLGTILRRFWTLENTLWQAQRPIPGVQDCDILRDSVGLAALLSKADIALCLAWTLNTKGGTFGTNLALIQAILHATPIAAHLFFASSAAIYGDNTSCPHETSPLDPRTEYARAKVAVEACAGASPHRTTCLRIRNVAGCDAILGGWYQGITVDARGLKTPPPKLYQTSVICQNNMSSADITRAPESTFGGPGTGRNEGVVERNTSSLAATCA